MRLDDLKEIHGLVEAKYEIRRQAFQALVKRENALRSEIQRIDDQARQANRSEDKKMQSIGADVLWKSWVGKAKSSLNIKLALVLAEKEQHVRQVKQAYGKVIAAESLTKEFTTQERKARAQKMLAAAIDTSIFKR